MAWMKLTQAANYGPAQGIEQQEVRIFLGQTDFERPESKTRISGERKGGNSRLEEGDWERLYTYSVEKGLYYLNRSPGWEWALHLSLKTVSAQVFCIPVVSQIGYSSTSMIYRPSKLNEVERICDFSDHVSYNLYIPLMSRHENAYFCPMLFWIKNKRSFVYSYYIRDV